MDALPISSIQHIPLAFPYIAYSRSDRRVKIDKYKEKDSNIAGGIIYVFLRITNRMFWLLEKNRNEEAGYLYFLKGGERKLGGVERSSRRL